MQSSAIRYTCVQSDAIRCKYNQVQLTYSKIRSMDEKVIKCNQVQSGAIDVLKDPLDGREGNQVQPSAIKCNQVQLTYSKIRSMDEKAAARSSVILVQCLRKRESSSAYEIASPKAAGEAVTDAPV